MRTSHPLLGHELGGYTLESVLGSGGMGTVFEAVDGAARPVALKLLHPGFNHDEEARRRLRREVATLHRVRGAGVAQVIDAELEGDHAFIVTELIEGDTLEASVADMGPLGAAELSDFAVGMAISLGSIHAVGVIHRDLKPSNVMLTEEGPVLIDFGISQAADDARITSTGLVTGTPGYVDPAVVGGGAVTIAADWWGWAAVLVFAATGKAPFGTGPWPAVFARVNQGQPALDGVPDQIATPLRAALHPDPQMRMLPVTVLEHLEKAALEQDAPTTVAPQTLPAVSSVEHDFFADGDTAEAPAVMPPTFEPGRAPAPIAASPDLQTGIEAVPPTRKYIAPAPVANAALDVMTNSENGLGGWQPQNLASQDLAPQDVAPQESMNSQGALGSMPGQWWQLEQGQSPAWAQRPPSRPGIAAAWWLAAAGLAIVWPGVVLIVSAVMILCLGIIGTNRRSLRIRRWQRGVSKADGAVTLMKLPWHVLKSLFMNLPGAILGFASGAIVWLLVDVPHYQGLVAAGSVSVLLLMAWCIPSAATVREGAAHLLRYAAKPGWDVVWIVIPLAMAIMAILVGMGAEWQEAWEPFPVPPRLS